MDFTKYSHSLKPSIRLMKPGDMVITYERHDSMSHVYLEEGKIFNNKFGCFHHDDFINQPFGSKILSRSTSGWLYALEANPSLWAPAINVRPFRND